MGKDDISITQDPRILIQQILGKVLDGKDDRVTINIIMIGNAGNMETGREKKEMVIQVQSKSDGIWHKLKRMVLPNTVPELPKIGYENQNQVPGEGLSYRRQKQNSANIPVTSKETILQVLGETNWNQRKAAEILKLKYSTFRERMKKFGIRKGY